MEQTSIPRETINAYQTTVYRVLGTKPFDLHIGQRSQELNDFSLNYDSTNSAFLTAFNPGSIMRSEAVNKNAQKKLESFLTEQTISFCGGMAIDSLGIWPDELGVLAFGISLEEANAIGSKFGQNGIVWIDKNFTPQLILLC